MQTYIGKGVTIHKRGASEAYTVIEETKSKKTLIIQKDKAILNKNPEYFNVEKANTKLLINQRELKYKYERDEKGLILKIRQLKCGNWKIIGKTNVEFFVEIGIRKELNYTDY